MILRILVYFCLILTLHGCGGRPVVTPTPPVGIPLQDVCDRYHVSWQWDGVTQVVMMEYRGNISKALVGSSTVLIGKQQITLSAPLRRENSTIYVPEDFESKILAPFGVPIAGLSPVGKFIPRACHCYRCRSRWHKICGNTMAPGFGMDEKDIVLDVAKRLKAEPFWRVPGFKVILK